MRRGESKQKRHQAQREKFCQALAAGNSAEEAGKIAGYKGAANARRNAQRADVKARVKELLQPALEKIQQQIDISAEYLLRHCHEVIEAAKRLTPCAEVGDGLRAADMAAKMQGIYAADNKPTVSVQTSGPLNVFYKREPRPADRSTDRTEVS